VTILAGGVISLLLIVTRLRSRRDYIPYGPFLVIGGVFALLWGRPIVDDYLDEYREERVSETGTRAHQPHVQPCSSQSTSASGSSVSSS